MPTGLHDPKQSPEVDKRCENCKWWNRRMYAESKNHGICNYEMQFSKIWCDPQGIGIVHNMGALFGSNFCCIYWQPKEEE